MKESRVGRQMVIEKGTGLYTEQEIRAISKGNPASGDLREDSITEAGLHKSPFFRFFEFSSLVH